MYIHVFANDSLYGVQVSIINWKKFSVILFCYSSFTSLVARHATQVSQKFQ